ncbi:NAD(P)H-hydrate dehydratase [Ekhidna sp. To15]|uniref:NAD(P)H-hydrate dehydratase n=1 Tax=Ekhidna sp. To15 TaxID=3395267 RepID=UPI003F51CE0D
MKILSAQQIREADQFTIAHEPIASIDLMERASEAFVNKFLGLHPEKSSVYIFCGTGNNGGDGLAIARLLIAQGWKIEVYIVGESDKGSTDFKINLKKVSKTKKIESQKDFPNIENGSIIIDGIFGSGLSRPVEGLFHDLIIFLNGQEVQRIAIDIASGLFADQPLPLDTIAFEPDYTISFQTPKLTFFLPEYAKHVGEWRVVNIGLDQGFLQQQETQFRLSEANELRELVPVRSTFSHKSQVGRLMIVAGSKGKMGAAVLCARGAMRSGAGLINVHVPSCGVDILQTSIPEAMVNPDNGEECIESILETTDTVAIGPGMGTAEKSAQAMRAFLEKYDQPMVIDADGINILAEHPDLIKKIPRNSILTPHPGEFKRLVGTWSNDFEKLQMLRTFCVEKELNIVVKGAFSTVCNIHGIIYFNPTGNPGLATAGSGDVLTGIAGALLAQGLEPFDALRLAVYLHGSAGDEAVRQLQTPWILASEIIDFIPKALSSLVSG